MTIKELLEKLKITKLDMKRYATDLAGMIRVRTRLGYGCAVENGAKGKFQKLADSTVKAKKKSSKLNRSLTSPTKSNLTNTGVMLDSLTGRSTGDFSGEVYLKGKRNNDVASYHEEGNPNLPQRPFMHIDTLTRKKLVDLIRRDIIKTLKK